MKTLLNISIVLIFVMGTDLMSQKKQDNYLVSAFIRSDIGDMTGAIRDMSDASAMFLKEAVDKDSIGDLPEALNRINNAILFDPLSAENYFERGKLRDKVGEHAKALEDLNKAIELVPENASAYIYRAHVKYHLKKYKAARKDYSKAIKKGGASEIVYANRAVNYAAMNKNKKAMSDLNKAIEINGKYGIAYFNRAQLQKKLGEKEEALNDFDKAIELSNEITKLLSVCDFHSDNMNLNGIDLNPGIAEFFAGKKSNVGHFCNANEPIPDLLKIISSDAENAKIYFYRGIEKMDARNYQGAINDYNRSIDLYSFNYLVYFYRAEIKFKKGDYWGAIEDLDKCIELDQKFPDAYQNRGIIELLLKQKDKACIDFSKAGELGCTNIYQVIIKHCNN